MTLEVIFCLTSFFAPLIGSTLICFFGKEKNIREHVSILTLSISLISSLTIFGFLLKKAKVFLWADIIYMDGFSVLMQLVTEFTALLVVIYSINYLSIYDHRKDSFHIYFAFILLCTAFMNLSFSLNNLFFVYITLELSSIFAVYLISFRQSKESLHAGFKYLIFVNIGILFSLIGIILFSFYTGETMSISNTWKNLSLLNKYSASVCAGFFIIGFFTKSGLFPLHLWLPDTYKESPTPITVFLSGALTKIGFYGIARTVTIFSVNFEEIKFILLFLASVSMLFGAILAFDQKEIKKLIAYCSIGEMGFIAAALSLNSYEGIFGGVFHIINHTLIKGILFFSVGAITYIIGQKEDINLNKNLSVTFYFLGALAAGGMPFFGSFLSSMTIFLALAREGYLLFSIVLIISEFIIAISLIRYGINEFWKKNNKIEKNQQLPTLLILPIIVLCILLILFGIYPEFISPLIDLATDGILKMISWRF